MNIETNLIAKLKAWKQPKVAIVSLTQDGRNLAKTIQNGLFPKAENFIRKEDEQPCQANEQPLNDNSAIQTIQIAFQQKDLIICIMATGIVVRAIAPLLVDKTSDPAIIVIDDQGKHVISLLSGHIGNANQWTKEIAAYLQSDPVITTATDARGWTGIDELAMHLQAVYQDFKMNTRRFNLLIANRKRIGIVNDSAIELPSHLLQEYIMIEKDELPKQLSNIDGLIFISHAKQPLTQPILEQIAAMKIEYVQLIPRRYVIGVGCRKDTASDVLESNFEQFIQEFDLHPMSIAKLVSIDVKKEEVAIIDLARALSAEFETFSKETLLQYEALYPGSEFVKKTVGVASVSQTAAHHETNGQVLSGRYANQGVTFTLAKYE